MRYVSACRQLHPTISQHVPHTVQRNKVHPGPQCRQHGGRMVPDPAAGGHEGAEHVGDWQPLRLSGVWWWDVCARRVWLREATELRISKVWTDPGGLPGSQRAHCESQAANGPTRVACCVKDTSVGVGAWPPGKGSSGGLGASSGQKSCGLGLGVGCPRVNEVQRDAASNRLGVIVNPGNCPFCLGALFVHPCHLQAKGANSHHSPCMAPWLHNANGFATHLSLDHHTSSSTSISKSTDIVLTDLMVHRNASPRPLML
jgi:hypothetical protein